MPYRVLKIYTDGAALHNGQPYARGGYGVVCPFDRSLDCHGFFTHGNQTCNRYELEGIKRGLLIAMEIDGKCHIKIYTDSRYAIGALTNWLAKWKRNGWMTNAGKPVKNRELIESIDELMRDMDYYDKSVELVHVRGHQSNYYNDEADRLAKLGAELNNVHDCDSD